LFSEISVKLALFHQAGRGWHFDFNVWSRDLPHDDLQGEKMMKKFLAVFGVLVLGMTLLTAVASADGPPTDGLVGSIVKAPIIPDGAVAGAATDVVITLDTSLDPSVPGRTLLEGRTIKVTLPDGFKETAGLPFASPGSSPDCRPGNVQCNTGVLLQGWPQHPIAPPFQKYAFSYEADTNTIVYTALQDLVPNPPLEPGIKQMHLILVGFQNPGPGRYRVWVEAETGPGGAVESGWGNLHIIPKIRPSINITSAFNAGTPNTIYQEATPGALTPLPYDFLLWNRDGEPFTDVTIKTVNPRHSLLMQGNRVVGHVRVDAPRGATGQEVISETPSFPVDSPVLVVPTARLTAQFRAGSAPGLYVVTFELNGGNSVQMFVYVE
jgi:hypothetical protein